MESSANIDEPHEAIHLGGERKCSDTTQHEPDDKDSNRPTTARQYANRIGRHMTAIVHGVTDFGIRIRRSAEPSGKRHTLIGIAPVAIGTIAATC